VSPPDLHIALAYVVLILVACLDAALSRLSVGARALWCCCLVFLPAAGLFAWFITRASAHTALEAVPSTED
jgi:F0F1-type ATP synthase assembly protein I